MLHSRAYHYWLAVPVAMLFFLAGGPSAAAQVTTPVSSERSTPALSSAQAFVKGEEFFDAGRYEDALGAFLLAIQDAPRDARAYYNAGVVYAKLGRADEAAAAFRRAAEIKPGNVKAHAGLCGSLLDAGRLREAIIACARGVRLAPDDQRLRYHLGQAFAAAGFDEQAAETLQAAIRGKPDFAEAHLALGLTYRRLGEYRESLESLGRAVRLSGGAEEAVRARAAVEAEMKGLERELGSVEGYERLLRLGDGYRLKGWYARAAAIYRHAAQVTPGDARAHYLEGLSHYGNNRYTRAVAAYERALKLNPKMTEAKQGLNWLTRYLRGHKSAAR